MTPLNSWTDMHSGKQQPACSSVQAACNQLPAVLCCVQDMAAFGYSDGSRDTSSSMPVQL